MMQQKYYFLGAEYLATGEGSTHCVLITRAYPLSNSIETPEETALREFAARFDSFMAIGAKFYTQEEFFTRFNAFIPQVVRNMLAVQAGNFHWSQEIHMNFG